MSMPCAATLSLALLLGALAARAQTTDSPFLPAGSSGQDAPAENNATLELRGIVVEPTGPIFNVVDAATKKGAWVGLNETGHEFVVTGYESQEGNESAAISYRGQSLRLPLAKGKIGAAAASPVPAGAPVAAGRPAPAQPPISPVVLNPTPADEARRLEAVAAELRRRREQRQLERQQAKQPQNQLPPPTPPGGQPTP